MHTERIFGNPGIVAVRYKAYSKDSTNEVNQDYAYCHFIIGDKLIGNADEACFLKGWARAVTSQSEFIKKNEKALFPFSFIGMSDREVFESILKTNQLEEDFLEEYRYLPQLPRGIWQRHVFRLDETVDAYLFYFYVRDSQITFLIEEVPRPKDRSRTRDITVTTAGLQEFLAVVDSIKSCLLTQYPYLKDHVSTEV